jgi:RHS repeat-associated protein
MWNDLTSPAFTLHVARDAMGNVTAIGNAAGANPATETYSYDPLYRLTGITDAGTALESYTYNPTGDRLSKTASGLATGTYAYTSGTHQLASIGNAARTNDANGNTTGSVLGGNTYGFGYNGRNRLTTAQLNGSTVGTYTYNALGQRTAKVATFPVSVSQRFVYDEASQLIGEYGTSNKDYIWLGSLPVAVIDNTVNGSVTTSTVNYVTADQLGTPRAVTDSTGAVVWQWAYQGNPFGEQQPTSTTSYVLNLRYPGQYYDAELGTNHNVNRNYESATGRYLQSDPIGLAGGISTYAYVSGNPLDMVDPLGLDGMIVNFPNYMVDTGMGFKLPLGHSGVVAIDPKTGQTQYFDLGRYGGQYGDVRGPFDVGRIEFDSNGNPTPASLAAVMLEASDKFGHGYTPMITYSKDADASKMIAFALNRQSHMSDHPYAINPFGKSEMNFCHKFAKDDLSAGMNK